MDLILKEILDFYDIPLVFIAIDSKGHKYLCYNYDIESDGTTKYFGRKVSNELFQQYINGSIDLRSIFENVNKDIFKIIEKNFKHYEAFSYINYIEDELLPLSGFYNLK